jgi:hypothetical protein
VDKLRRYFVGNSAPIFKIGRSYVKPRWRPLRCSTGNSGGYYWLYWRITWRMPYADVWQYNSTHKRWEIAHWRPT